MTHADFGMSESKCKTKISIIHGTFDLTVLKTSFQCNSRINAVFIEQFADKQKKLLRKA